MNLQDVELMLGRINGVHAGLVCIARFLTPQAAAAAAAEVARSAEAIHADGLDTPLTDPILAEQHRVLHELAFVLRKAAQSQ